jgi:chorismate-pyruvate lyase
MAPKQQTNWQLYKSAKDLVNPNMASWVEENNSLMKRLNDEKQKISLRVVLEKICQHDEKEIFGKFTLLAVQILCLLNLFLVMLS